MVQTGYCPRGPFCAFAHVERKYMNDLRQTQNFKADIKYCECTKTFDNLSPQVLIDNLRHFIANKNYMK